MASESREDAVAVDLPEDLEDWLDARAAELGVDRAEAVRRVLVAHRAAASLDEGEPASLAEQAPGAAVEPVADVAAERLADRFATREDVAALDEEFQTKIEDVRERVIQVKREADAKAPADHSHEGLDRVESLAGELAALEEDVASLRESVEADRDDRSAADDELRERLDDVEDKLERVAWAVSDLKQGDRSRGSRERALDRIKRAAAQEGIESATCENCGERVSVALLTDPECPHCKAAVSDVRPEGGIIRSRARLVAASQLEAGDEETP
ncbi:hypothetical protein [Halomicrobium salinisoli]|uniref:hypothetical protein n=1 Tax=Halomicrobium salinisoli TaxID=2878391 RepID=UPI001CF0429A|nr:hypothetical protein [Halomicrobium salinisoli]